MQVNFSQFGSQQVEEGQSIIAALKAIDRDLTKRACVARVNGKTVKFRQFENLFSRLFFPQKARGIRLYAENYIVENGKTFNKFEMLMYHSYPKRVCIVRVFYFNLFSVFENFSLFRVIKTEKHRHKR